MRNIPEDNLAYPVLLKLATGPSGSGFQLNTGEKFFLITAKHVLFNKKSGKLKCNKLALVCPSRELSDDSTTMLSIDLKKASVLQHKTADVAAIKLGIRRPIKGKKEYRVTYHDYVKVLKSSQSSTVSVSAKKTVKLLKDVLISNDVFLYGYPTSLGLKNTPQFDYNKPLLRKGIVANINHAQGTIILDCPVYYGNSGGPIVEVAQKGSKLEHRVIGVVSQFIPFAQNWVNQSSGISHKEIFNSGYSVAVSMDKVFELIGFKPNAN